MKTKFKPAYAYIKHLCVNYSNIYLKMTCETFKIKLHPNDGNAWYVLMFFRSKQSINSNNTCTFRLEVVLPHQHFQAKNRRNRFAAVSRTRPPYNAFLHWNNIYAQKCWKHLTFTNTARKKHTQPVTETVICKVDGICLFPITAEVGRRV